MIRRLGSSIAPSPARQGKASRRTAARKPAGQDRALLSRRSSALRASGGIPVGWEKPWKRYKVKPGEKIELRNFNPKDGAGAPISSKALRKRTRRLLEKIDKFQERMYADQGQSLLIVLQGMDTGGKDGVIRHVIRGMSPQGVSVTSFKQPTPEELSHDFLWRIRNKLPNVGQVGVFNRSHYEDVVVVRVLGLVPENVWRPRYATIRQFEQGMARPADGKPPVKIVKLFLNISQDEQWSRLKERLDEKPWKLSESDFLDLNSWENYTKKWNEYQKAWEDAINETSTKEAPWYVVPADNKDVRDYIAARILYKTFKEMQIPKPEPKVDITALKAKVARMDHLR